MIINITNSPKKHKRFRVYMDDGRHFDFGSGDAYANGSDAYAMAYIDHGDKKKRFNYWARHMKNHTEQTLVDNLVPSPALFSATLLWGHSTNLDDNIRYLNNEWRKWHK